MSTSHTKTLNEFELGGIVWNDYTTPDVLRRAHEFRFRPSDICVCTYPRCGNTITQEIIWHLVHRDTIQKGVKYPSIDDRFPHLEFNYGWGATGPVQWGIDTLEAAGEDQTRLIKTHCPYSFIGQRLDAAKPKVIVVLRNPKDCCNSLYNFYKGLEMYGPWPGKWEEFVDMFLQGKTTGGDYFKVISEWWQMRDRPNLLLIKFEDLVRSPEDSICRIADFIGIRPTQEQLNCVVYNTKFESMFNNENVNLTFATGCRFLRKGVVGDWKNQFTAEQSKAFDKVCQEKLSSIGLEFDYE